VRLVGGVKSAAWPGRDLCKRGSALWCFGCSHNPLFGLAGGGVLKSLQFFSGLEPHGLSWGNTDFFAGAGIAADAGLTGLHAEDAELAEFDALAAAHGVLQGLKDGLHGLFRFGAADVGLRYDSIYDVQLNHTDLPVYEARC